MEEILNCQSYERCFFLGQRLRKKKTDRVIRSCSHFSPSPVLPAFPGASSFFKLLPKLSVQQAILQTSLFLLLVSLLLPALSLLLLSCCLLHPFLLLRVAHLCAPLLPPDRSPVRADISSPRLPTLLKQRVARLPPLQTALKNTTPPPASSSLTSLNKNLFPPTEFLLLVCCGHG